MMPLEIWWFRALCCYKQKEDMIYLAFLIDCINGPKVSHTFKDYLILWLQNIRVIMVKFSGNEFSIINKCRCDWRSLIEIIVTLTNSHNNKTCLIFILCNSRIGWQTKIQDIVKQIESHVRMNVFQLLSSFLCVCAFCADNQNTGTWVYRRHFLCQTGYITGGLL